jgi:hypothetical protein
MQCPSTSGQKRTLENNFPRQPSPMRALLCCLHLQILTERHNTDEMCGLPCCSAQGRCYQRWAPLSGHAHCEQRRRTACRGGAIAGARARLLELRRHGVEVGAVGAVHRAAQAPVAHAVGRQEVAGPGVAPAAEGHVALVLEDLLVQLVCARARPSGASASAVSCRPRMQPYSDPYSISGAGCISSAKRL